VPAVRVAYFADSFHEVNGMARTSRELDGFARRTGMPFLCVRVGDVTKYSAEGSTAILELRRASASIPVDKDLSFDPLLGRHLLRAPHSPPHVKPDVAHLTGPGDYGP